jgi:hypothetical protein
MINHKKQLSESEIKNIKEHLKRAIEFLEKNGIVHRDIKPGNIYYDSINKRPLLFDFNSACYSGDDCKTGEFIGTQTYAPHILQALRENPFTRYNYTSKDDMEALKIIETQDLPKITKHTFLGRRSRVNAELNTINNTETRKRSRVSRTNTTDSRDSQEGGYRATKRNMKYLKKWKRGEPIGFTMRSSLKAKGLIPRANGLYTVSKKYL